MNTKNIQITLFSKSIKNRTVSNELVWRSWKIMIHSVHSDLNLSSCIDRVEYLLHPSFRNPHIVCTQEPYRIQQEGWGEFDLRITFHFRDGSPPQVILFDVNFRRSKYSVYQKLNINESSLMKQLKKRQRQASFSSASSSPIITTPIDEYTTFINPNLALHKENDPRKQPLFDPTRKPGCRPLHATCMSPEETFTHTEKPSYWNASENVNLSELATCLESLDDNCLREVYHIILQYDTKDMAIVETQVESRKELNPCSLDEVLFDLCTLSPCLVTELWRYTSHIKERERKSNQEKCKQDIYEYYSDVYVTNNAL